MGDLLAISDLHVEHRENREVLEGLRPRSDGDWLLVAGDVANSVEKLEWALGLLRERFATVVWVPGNHELHSYGEEGAELRGVARYEQLVETCRGIDVITPEDPFPVWEGHEGSFRIAPLFLLYDYSFGRLVSPDRSVAMERAFEAGVVCSDEFALHPDPFPSRESWCRWRVAQTEMRLEASNPQLPTVLVNHFPLRIEATQALAHPEFAQWCGTELTSSWHERFRAVAVVYGHLHIRRTMWHDGVPFEEVSLGNPREWKRRRLSRPWLSCILPRR